jgi:hypothetical protein
MIYWPFLVFVVIAALATLLYHSVIHRMPSESIRLDWVVDTSVPHYRGILSALDSNASFKQRIEQRRIVRRHLCDLRGEFIKLTYMVKQLIVMSPRDRPDLSAILLRHSVLFNLLALLIEWRLVVHLFGGRAQRTRFFVNVTMSILVSIRELAKALTTQFLAEVGEPIR